jgi:hypothetical protein
MGRVSVLMGRAAWVVFVLLPMLALADGADSGRAADPGAAAAPLLLEDSLRGYRPLDGVPLPWTRLFDAEGRFRDAEALQGTADALANPISINPISTLQPVPAQRKPDHSRGTRYRQSGGVAQ